MSPISEAWVALLEDLTLEYLVYHHHHRHHDHQQSSFIYEQKCFTADDSLNVSLTSIYVLKYVCARLAQVVRPLTTNQKVPGSIPYPVEG